MDFPGALWENGSRDVEPEIRGLAAAWDLESIGVTAGWRRIGRDSAREIERAGSVLQGSADRVF